MQTIRQGDQGATVALAQEYLNSALALDPPLELDGDFGPRTLEAVIAFQSSSVGSNGQPLFVDGVVGPQTWWALQAIDQADAFGSAPRSVQRRGAARGPFSDRVISIAAHERAARAREIGENNAGHFVEKYLRGKRGPWCAGFVSWCVHQAAEDRGHPAPFDYSGGARNILDQLHARGMKLPGGEDPQPGDVVVWWRESPSSWKGHIGIVTDVASGMIWTIEGNRGGFPAPVRQFSYVLERERRLLGFGRLE